MTEPEQVSVNVADLRVIKDWWYGNGATNNPFQPSDTETRHAFFHLFDAIPEPVSEWELTDDMRAKWRRARIHYGKSRVSDSHIDLCLRALHREGLL